MKVARILCIAALFLSSVGALQTGLSPVTRVVDLMKGLTTKIEAEGKKEEDLYETFVCWAKTVIDTKTSTNEAAQSRIDELKAYVGDIQAGRVEFTNERGTLGKELDELNGDIESSNTIREKENEDFMEAEEEMENAIKALKKAIAVLDAATAEEHLWPQYGDDHTKCFKDKSEHVVKDRKACQDEAVAAGSKYFSYSDSNKYCSSIPTSCDSPITGTKWPWKIFKVPDKASAVLLDLGEGQGFAQRAEAAKMLVRAADLGEKVLSKGDSEFLRRVLTGDVPNVDKKKLRRTATFKMKYKARSFKILGVMQKMLETFEANLKSATEKEKIAQEDFDQLMAAKKSQKKQTMDAQANMQAETGAREKAQKDAKAELDALEEQVQADERFIKQTTDDLAKKKSEWKVRQELRAAEVAAISKAISILHGDDARDLFRKSYSSQGYFLLQVSESTRRGARAAEVLRSAGAAARDRRLKVLGSRVELQARGHLHEVVESIERMLNTLEEEQNSDSETKDMCESERRHDANKAAEASRSIDDDSDAVSSLTAEVAQIKEDIKDNEAKFADVTKELQEATKMRKEERAEWKQASVDDTNALQLVKMARGVLEDFYKDNDLKLIAFVQQKKMEPVVAGQAPPPPPATWEAPYGGAPRESTGILAMLDIIKEDIQKDLVKAKQEEKDAQKEFWQFKKEAQEHRANLKAQTKEMKARQGDRQSLIEESKKSRKDKKKLLDAVMKKMQDAIPLCDFMTINFETRKENRKIEVDALIKAKGLLQGASP
eukprot:gnl/TRDRNA2_/TRDRNA2_177556_c0_seq4.p1 gnl/TRDRNA2_/TRDRNA2_177556_c0~~gnl/TRDRNA2_/TRDRNA2_177556_c0_seq4.p1  ORF type:complete len:788 (-),score=255.14 gnl/TRDRNA2_/TRDRNA2_177556_c0_seq4:191-2515(-)